MADINPKKMADEMFAELGYRKIKDGWYEHGDGRTISTMSGHFIKYRVGPMSLTFDEVLACAKLVLEMEDVGDCSI